MQAVYIVFLHVRCTLRLFAHVIDMHRKKKRRMADRILPQRVRDLVPESQAYMDLLCFERKLDQTIMRKRLDIQEALKKPMKVRGLKMMCGH